MYFHIRFDKIKKQQIIRSKVNAILDRTNTNVRKASMLAASVFNEVVVPTSTVTQSKSTIHCHRRKQGRNQLKRSVNVSAPRNLLNIGMADLGRHV